MVLVREFELDLKVGRIAKWLDLIFRSKIGLKLDTQHYFLFGHYSRKNYSCYSLSCKYDGRSLAAHKAATRTRTKYTQRITVVIVGNTMLSCHLKIIKRIAAMKFQVIKCQRSQTLVRNNRWILRLLGLFLKKQVALSWQFYCSIMKSVTRCYKLTFQ